MCITLNDQSNIGVEIGEINILECKMLYIFFDIIT